MEEENKFYRSRLNSRRYIIPFIIILLQAVFIIKRIYILKDDGSFLFLLILLVLPIAILGLVAFIYWLISLKNAKKSYIKLSQKSMIVNNCYGFLKIRTEFSEIEYIDIDEIKIFFDFTRLCYNVNIHKKGETWRHCAIVFELKINDYERLTETLNLYWVTFSRQSHF